ncbi:MAG: hypothetical protein WCZ89_00405 [Phycisphaerae bacterium]
MRAKANKIRYRQQTISSALTIVEILIVVAVLGILTAILIPEYKNYTQKAREEAAKENLRVLRAAVERYSLEHNGVAPGYPLDDTSAQPSYTDFVNGIVTDNRYLAQMPNNPFNGRRDMIMLGNNESFPAEASGTTGWIYKPATQEIRLNQPGNDSQGEKYYDY